MASLVKKMYLLITTLACLIHFNAAIELVPGIPVNVGDPIPQRLELRTFIADSTRLNLFLLALERMQTTPTSSFLSHYRLGGIHGSNMVWDGNTGGNFPSGLGYCYHVDRLFLTWHRPYLSLFEKTLYDLATTIVQGFPEGDVKNRSLAALRTFRLPYWDWGVDPSLPFVLGSSTEAQNVTVTKVVSGVLTNVVIPNPLYSYRLQIFNDPFTSIPRPLGQTTGQTRETVRSPRTVRIRINGIRTSVYQSQPSVSNTAMINAGPTLRNSVGRAFRNAATFGSFSSMGESADSIESVHGTVHVTVGNGGHMSTVEHAGFDPIFFLHHANIDRYFAMWQVLNPNSYLSSSPSAIPNENTPLHPFRRTSAVDDYWTSATARNVTNFGYTYPELVGATQASMTTIVNNLYGAGITVSGKRKRQITTDSPDEGTTYNDYVVRIKIANNALKRSFAIYACLGESISNQTDYATNPDCVGPFGVFTRTNLPKSHRKLIYGKISVSTVLSKHYDEGKLPNMTPNIVKKYVEKNFYWGIVGDTSAGVDLDGCEIDIDEEEVYVPNRKDKLATRKQTTNIYKVH